MKNMALRKAVMQDAELLFHWRNDPDTRANSLKPEQLQWEKHLQWLAVCLKNPDRALYIAEVDSVPCGTVRADKIGSEYELSWTVAPEQRGNGFGRRMVAALIEILPEEAYYQAVVLNDNAASHLIAQRLGMEAIEVENGVVTYQGRRRTP